MNTKSFVSRIIVLILFSSTSFANNLSSEVSAFVKDTLLKDDYGALLNDAIQETVEVSVREATTPPGMNAKRVGNTVFFFSNDSIFFC